MLLERGWVILSTNFRGKGGSSTNDFWRQKTRVSAPWAITWCCLHDPDPTFSRFDTLPACDTQTHTHTHRETHRHTMMAITRAGKNCTDSTVDNNHALHTHEALHRVTAIKFYVKVFFCLGFGGPSALGALGCSPFSPLGNPGLLIAAY